MCFKCREWKADEGFPHKNSGGLRRRGRSNYCRSCETIARQQYRERIKVPCVGCGKPALPQSEKGTRGRAEPRCRSCSRRAYAAVQPPAEDGGEPAIGAESSDSP